MLATLDLIKKAHPKKIVVALPVAPSDTLEKIKQHADQVACVLIPPVFYSVGQFYKEFKQVDDQEAIQLLHEANR